MITSQIVEASSAQVHIREAIHRKPLIDVRSQEGTIPPSTSGWNTSIELRNVTFAYPSRPDFNSLDGVSFSMEAEKVTAIVGPSGSGKSTVAGLLTRWWDLKDADDKGNQLLIGGTDIKEYNLRWLRSQISTVSQDPVSGDYYQPAISVNILPSNSSPLLFSRMSLMA